MEAVLPVRARLPPDDGRRVDRDRLARERHALAVRLHDELLEVRREPVEVLLVRQHRVRLGAEEVAIPDTEQPHQQRHVPLRRRLDEVPVHGVEAGEELGERLGPDRDHRREADRGVHRVPAADPVPEAERVRRVDPELATASRFVETATT